jgi:hypothetical protein
LVAAPLFLFLQPAPNNAMTIWKTKLNNHSVKIVAQDFDKPANDCCSSHNLYRREVVGIGFETKRDGAYLRAAVEMRKNPSLEEMQEALDLLFKAFLDPEANDVKVVRGDVELTPNVMQTKALKEQTEKK